MKTLLISFMLFAALNESAAQNVIQNPGFEEYDFLPTYWANLEMCKFWSDCNGVGSPDYYHVNGSYYAGLPNCWAAVVHPHSGNAIAGLSIWSDSTSIDNFREYLSIQFSTPLVVGYPYTLSYWVTNGESNHNGGYSANHLGVNLSVDELVQIGTSNIDITPTFDLQSMLWTTEWVQIEYNFIADSAYEYLTVGNFYHDLMTSSLFHVTSVPGIPYGSHNPLAYYFFDDFNLAHSGPHLSVDGDSVICLGDSVTLTAVNGFSYEWYAENSNFCFSQDSIVTVSPSVTTTYTVQGTVENQSFTVYVIPPPDNYFQNYTLCADSTLTLELPLVMGTTYLWENGSTENSILISEPGIYLAEIEHECGSASAQFDIDLIECVTQLEMPNVFTPNGDGINDSFIPLVIKGVNFPILTIFNRWGNLVYETTDLIHGWDGFSNGIKCKTGTYFWKLDFSDVMGHDSSLDGFLYLTE